MKHSSIRWPLALWYGLLLLTIGCEKPSAEAPKTAVAPSKTTHPVSEAGLNTIELTEDAVTRLGLETQPVSMRTMPRTRSYGAELVMPPGTSIIVSSPMAGTLQLQSGENEPKIGQKVAEGESLLQLLPMLSPERDVLTPSERIRFAEAHIAVLQSQNDAEAAVQQSLVQVEAAQIALDRAERLLKDKSGTVRTVDEAQAQLKMAEKMLEAARTRKEIADSIKLDAAAGTLTPLIIRSPLTGILRSIQVQPGQIVSSGAPLFEVMNDDRLWVRVPVYVGDIDELDLEGDARLTLLDGRPLADDMVIKPISAPPTAMALASTVDLYYELPNSDSSYRPGQRIGASLTLKGDAETAAIPWSSVYYDIYGGQWVYEKVAERQFVRRRVEVSQVSDGWAAIVRGPETGAEIVTAAVAELAGTEFGFAK